MTTTQQDTLMERDAEGNVLAAGLAIKVPHDTSALFVLGGGLRVQGGIQSGDEVVREGFYSVTSATGQVKACQEKLRHSGIYTHSRTLHSLEEVSKHILRLLKFRRGVSGRWKEAYQKLLDNKYSCAPCTDRSLFAVYKVRDGMLTSNFRETKPKTLKNEKDVLRYHHIGHRLHMLGKVLQDLDTLAVDMIKKKLRQGEPNEQLIVTSYGIRRIFRNASSHYWVLQSGALDAVSEATVE